jgi:hypothetical protein
MLQNLGECPKSAYAVSDRLDWFGGNFTFVIHIHYIMTSSTNLRITFRAASGFLASQLKLGNSAHKPTYSLSSSDQVTL